MRRDEPSQARVGYAALVTAALGGAVYATVTGGRYRLVRLEVPLHLEAPELTILHLSDTHLRARDERLIAFLESLPEQVGAVDLVLCTGDIIDDDSGIEPVVDALSRFDARVGRFYVLGSHDYYQSTTFHPAKYFTGRRPRRNPPRADTARLVRGLDERGWVSLSNRAQVVEVQDSRIRLAGVDDPYIGRDRSEHIHRRVGEALAIALVHSPDVVSQWALNGFDLVLAGHTHGGQVRLPFVGAVVTNSTLPTALASGLHRVGECWLHVSPGLGTSKFAPVRFLAPPQATLLDLRPST